jgi:thiol-disulfide isomerase/thioredoxin
MICPHCNEFVPDNNYRCPKCRKVVRQDLDLLESQPKQARRGGPTFTHFLFIIVVVGLGVMAFFIFHQDAGKDAGKGTASTGVDRPPTRSAIERPAAPIENEIGAAAASTDTAGESGETAGQGTEQPAAGEPAAPADKPAEGEPAGTSEEKSNSDPTDPYAWVENEKEESPTPTTSHVPGEEVDIAQMVVKGKTTIFDFFSAYCGPCVKISPKLGELDNRREDIVVIKIDINREGIQSIDWESPVVKQYAIKSIPYFIIYDDTGARSHEGSAARQVVEQLLTREGIQ